MKVLDYVKETLCNPSYNPDYELEVVAAHERTDIKVTDKIRKHDDDLMDGEW